MVLDRVAGGEKGAARPDRFLTEEPAVICSGYNDRLSPPGSMREQSGYGIGRYSGLIRASLPRLTCDSAAIPI